MIVEGQIHGMAIESTRLSCTSNLRLRAASAPFGGWGGGIRTADPLHPKTAATPKIATFCPNYSSSPVPSRGAGNRVLAARMLADYVM